MNFVLQSQEDNIIALNHQNSQIMAQFKSKGIRVQPTGGVQNGLIQSRAQYFATRQLKIDFPHFNGEDINVWLYRCEQFFEVDDIPPKAKVKLAIINLKGKAL